MTLAQRSAMFEIEENAMAWDQELPGCFSETALEFAVHPNDEERAFVWLTSLRERHIGLAKAKAQISEYLQSRGASEARITPTLEKAERFLGPWLLD